MNSTTLLRYAPGGDIYNRLQAQYGTAGADKVYAAAQKQGTQANAVALALEELQTGTGELKTGTASIFLDQITTDPLAAPIESLNNQVGNAFKNLLVNPFALLVVVGLGLWGAYKLGIIRFKTRKI